MSYIQKKLLKKTGLQHLMLYSKLKYVEDQEPSIGHTSIQRAAVSRITSQDAQLRAPGVSIYWNGEDVRNGDV